MADTKLTELDAITSLPDTALLYAVIDPGTTPVSKSITGEALRTSLASYGSISVVYASGDETGQEDYDAIAAAIVDQTLSVASHGQGLVVLIGETFYVNAGIVIGDPDSNPTQRSCNITALGQAEIIYTGASTTDYLLSVYGVTYSPTPRVSNLYLNCATNCRGLLLHRQVYMSSVKHVFVYGARQVGVDWATSYKASATDLHITYTNGIAMRVWGAQGSSFTNCRIANTSATDFPATDDETVYDDYKLQWIQTPTANQAALVIYSQELEFRNIMFEKNNFGSTAKPIIHIECTATGNQTGSSNVRFTGNMYIENNTVDETFVKIAGRTSSASAWGREFVFEGVSKHDSTVMPTFITTSGYVSRVVVDGIVAPRYAGAYVTNVIVCSGSGSHLYNAEVRGSDVGVAYDDLIVAADSGVIEVLNPYDTYYSAMEAPRKKIEYDPTYGLLKFNTGTRWVYSGRDFITELAPEDWWSPRFGLGVLADGASITGNWTSIGSNATAIPAVANPVFRSSVYNSMPMIELSGSNYFEYGSALFSGTAGAVIIIGRRSTVAGTMMWFSQADTGGSVDYLEIGHQATTNLGYFLQVSGGVSNTQRGTENMSTNLFCMVVSSDGSTIQMWVDGELQVLDNPGANNGNWFAETAGCDNTLIGGIIRSTPLANTVTGYVGDIIVYDHAVDETMLLLAADQLMALYGI